MTRPVLYLIACAAGPTQHIDIGVRTAQADGWEVCLILTPTAAHWWEPRMGELETLTGRAVRSQYKLPGEGDSLPKAAAMLVAPLTTTSACKWAAGITDTVALGIPAEGVHLGIPVAAMPFWSTALGAQPAVSRALQTLREQGVRVLDGPDGYESHPPKQGNARAYPWHRALAAIA
ncbi:flavoprotein [Streptomyces sp. JJ66]|uniref:flavoprotein n=1 Tax=Streptomyces sp. JJ66 TaxID=2803843 RepID=UPI001C58B103|nr:flavoprotein [Streptomyces sp. JJ66]MBW1604638.1 flavoprotein [Streptomyces sp. JJ66]